MIGCLILGDSIAVGVGHARPECVTVAKVGIGSGAYVNTLYATAPHVAELAVISLGVNDGAGAATLSTLRRLRLELRANRVVWLLPGLKEDVRQFIRTVAAEHGDRTLDTRPDVGPDHLHPTGAGYRLIAAEAAGAATSGDRQMQARATQPIVPFWGTAARGLPVVHRGGVPMQWQPMLGAGSVYGAWPPHGAVYAAMPPPSFAYRALPGR